MTNSFLRYTVMHYFVLTFINHGRGKKKSKFKCFSWKFSSLTFFCLEGQCELRRGSIYLLLASASHLRLSSIFRPAALSSRRLPLFAPISSKVFLTRWINAICLHVALSHIFVAKQWSSCTSGTRNQFAVEYILWDVTIFDAADMAVLAQAPFFVEILSKYQHRRTFKLSKMVH